MSEQTLAVKVGELSEAASRESFFEVATTIIESVRSTVDTAARSLALNIYGNEYINEKLPVQGLLTYITVIGFAVALVYVGSFTTLDKPDNAKEPNPEHPLFDQSDNDTLVRREVLDQSEAMKEQHIYTMPVFAGVVLYGMYLVIQKGNVDALNYYLSAYIIFVGAMASSYILGFLLKTLIRKVCFKLGVSSTVVYKKYQLTLSNDVGMHCSGPEPNAELPQFSERERIIKEEKLLESRHDVLKEEQHFNYFFSYIDILSTLLGITFSYFYAMVGGSNNWILGNILGSNLAIFGISMTRIPSFKIAFLLLGLFFAYDIYFVFGTNVMVEVATKLQVPVKLIVPDGTLLKNGNLKASMLGLGDIVLPGTMVALCLRFDVFNFHAKHPSTEFYRNRSISKPYFYASLMGYTIGMFCTIFAVHFFRVAQPALLYLSPSVTTSVLLMAHYKGELKELFAYKEDNSKKEDSDEEENANGGGAVHEVRLSLMKFMKLMKMRNGEEDENEVKEVNIIDAEFGDDDDEDDEDYTIGPEDESKELEDLEEFDEIAEFIEID